MNQERWKELVEQEARRTQWQAAAGCLALACLVLMLVFEETKKYFRRRGHALEFLG